MHMYTIYKYFPFHISILTHFHVFPLYIYFVYNLCRIVESMVLVSQVGDIYRYTIYECCYTEWLSIINISNAVRCLPLHIISIGVIIRIAKSSIGMLCPSTTFAYKNILHNKSNMKVSSIIIINTSITIIRWKMEWKCSNSILRKYYFSKCFIFSIGGMGYNYLYI